ncbi:MAG: major capsid protein [Zoogloeaceae bacterium]|jgi:hypothetical protein|nr:major capsid protein [Zoogloeaceae bacterium]
MTLDDIFKVTSLTDAIAKIPVPPGLIGSWGLFEQKGVRTTSVLIEVRNGRLFLVPDSPRSSDPEAVSHSKRAAFPLRAAHLAASDVILPEDIQDIRGFGQEGTDSGLKSQATEINDRLEALKVSLEATLEYHRIGAVRGVVLDADGSVLVNLFDAFGVTKQALTIPFSSASTNVLQLVLQAKRLAEKKLGGVAYSGFRAVVGSDFFDALVGHKGVKEAYANWQAAQDRLGGDLRRGFVFAGVEFIEIPDVVGDTAFLPAEVGQLVPIGRGIFKQYFAPANYNEAVNTIGQPWYAKSEPRKLGKGYDIEAQTNPLTICTYPEALVELTAS